MKHFAILLLVCGLAGVRSVPAYEANTLIQSSTRTSDRMITLNAKSGLARVYDVQSRMQGHKVLQLYHSTFIIEDYRNLVMIKKYAPNLLHQFDRNEPEEVPYRRLMLGAGNRIPWVQFFGMVRGGNAFFSKKVIDEATGDSPLSLAYKAEMEFWKEPPAYNGEMLGAMSGNTAMFYVPITNVVLLYDLIENNRLTLKAYRTIRPELMINVPDGFSDFNSYPLFNEVKAAIRNLKGGRTLLAVRTRGLEQMLESMETDANPMSPVESDPFLGALTNRRYVLADMANNRIIVYQYTGESRGLELISLRNTELDRLLPVYPLPSRHLNQADRVKAETFMRKLSRNQRGPIDAYTQAIRAWIREQNFRYYDPDDLDIQVEIFIQFAKLADKRYEVEDGQEEHDWDARIMDIGTDSNRSQSLVIDLKRERRLYVYRPAGKQDKIELLTVQSYALDTAMAAYVEQLKDVQVMEGFYEGILRDLQRPSRAEFVLRQFDFLLAKTPAYYQKIEEEQRTKRWIKNLERWDEDKDTQLVAKYQGMMQEAQKAHEENLAERQQLVEAVQDVLAGREEALAAAAERDRNR